MCNCIVELITGFRQRLYGNVLKRIIPFQAPAHIFPYLTVAACRRGAPSRMASAQGRELSREMFAVPQLIVKNDEAGSAGDWQLLDLRATLVTLSGSVSC